MKCLLSIRPEMNSTPGYYIFNQLYLNDYATWLQTVPESHMISLANTIERVIEKISKEDVGLDLPELEEAAMSTIQEEEEKSVQNLVAGLTSVRVSEAVDSDDDSDDEEVSSSE